MDRATIGRVKAAARITLAHHPLCSYFDDDTLSLGSLEVCSGCAAAFPALWVGLAAAVAASATGLAPPLVLAGAGFALALPQAATYVYRGGLAFRLTAKALGGAGYGLAVVGGLLWPIGWPVKIAAGALVGVGFVALQLVRGWRMLATCRACPWRADWARCPGFREGTDPVPPRPAGRPEPHSAGGVVGSEPPEASASSAASPRRAP